MNHHGHFEPLHSLNQPPTRLLITTQDHPALFWEALEHVLHASWCHSLLVLTPTASRTELLHAWSHKSFLHEKSILDRRFPHQFSPRLPGDERTRISLATVREMQLHQRRQEPLAASQVDCMFLYQLPQPFSPLWQQVCAAMAGIPLVGFCDHPHPTTLAWFQEHAAGAEQTDNNALRLVERS